MLLDSHSYRDALYMSYIPHVDYVLEGEGPNCNTTYVGAIHYHNYIHHSHLRHAKYMSNLCMHACCYRVQHAHHSYSGVP